MNNNETKSYQLQIERLPLNLAELQAMPESDLKNPYATAALTVLALNVWPKDKEEAKKMLTFLSGPKQLTPMDWQFINDRFMNGVDYIPRSYFEGATPDNDYTPYEPFTLTIYDDPYTPDDKSYVSVMLQSGGADSKRKVTLRLKPSTGQYFLWDEFLLPGIRAPKSRDEWA